MVAAHRRSQSQVLDYVPVSPSSEYDPSIRSPHGPSLDPSGVSAIQGAAGGLKGGSSLFN